MPKKKQQTRDSVTVAINANQATHLRELASQAQLLQMQYNSALQALLVGNLEGEGNVVVEEIREDALVVRFGEE